jgi:hypothetical protein
MSVVFSANKTDYLNVAEMLLKVALNTINEQQNKRDKTE